MPLTIGLVHALYTDAAGGNLVEACVWIGPSPANVELLTLTRQVSDPVRVDAFKVSMLDLLVQALASRREVIVGHEEWDPSIYSVELR